jgi:hypothetical protein
MNKTKEKRMEDSINFITEQEEPVIIYDFIFANENRNRIK